MSKYNKKYYEKEKQKRISKYGNVMIYQSDKPCKKCNGYEKYVSNNRCVNCKRGNGRKYRETHLEEERERARKWYYNNKDHVKKYKEENKEYLAAYRHMKYWENREKELAQQATWYQNNKKYVKEYNKKYRKENEEKIKQIQQNWRENNPAYQREYKLRNPEISRLSDINRRSREQKAEGSFTTTEWLELLEKFDNKCLACDETENLHADHIIPLSRCGTNYIWNIQPLCAYHNLSKATKIIDYRPIEHIPIEFTEYLLMLQEKSS